jgi:hypothetical protein
MILASVTREIAVPLEKVQEVLSDYEVIPLVHPWAEKVTTINREPGLVGSHYLVHMVDGHEIHEEVIAWGGGEPFTIGVDHGPLLGKMISRVSIEGTDRDRTRVTIELQTAPGTGAIRRFLARKIVKPKAQRFFGGVIEGVEKYALTGEPVEKQPM